MQCQPLRLFLGVVGVDTDPCLDFADMSFGTFRRTVEISSLDVQKQRWKVLQHLG